MFLEELVKINPQKAAPLLECWEATLESYGTPGNFADGTKVQLLRNPSNRLEVPLVVFRVENYFTARYQLMEKQRREAEKRKYLEPRWPDDGADCFLCDNIGQALTKKDNLILPATSFDEAALLPNRYPSIRGHLLFVRKKHDSSTQKIPEVITPSYIDSLIRLSSEYELITIRNHPLAGRSIPEHEHVHVFPALVKDQNNKEVVASGLLASSLEHSRYDESIFRVGNSRFDTLAFCVEKGIDTFFSLLASFDRNKTVYSLIHYKHFFFVTPHISKGVDPDHKKMYGSAGIPGYGIISSRADNLTFNQHITTDARFYYAKQTFPWEDYL